MKKTIILGAIIFIVFTLVGIIFLNLTLTGNIIEKDKFSFTKAICNQTNYCEDYEIICNGKEIKKITPTGQAVQFSGKWEDPRTSEEIEKMCE